MMDEKEFTAACMQLMFLAGSLDSGEFERLFKAILDDRAELLAHVAELESWAAGVLNIYRHLKPPDCMQPVTFSDGEGADGGG